jgi:hypothetical protein
VLYRAVAENLQTYLALCREEAVAEDPVPAYVERELRHCHRYHGVLAPHSPLRAAVTALDREPDTTTARQDPGPKPTPADTAPPTRSLARYLWAALIARIYATWPLLCGACGAELRLVAFITAREPIDRILRPIGEPTRPPRVAPARGPPQPTDAGVEPRALWDELAQPTPEFQFDQTSATRGPTCMYQGDLGGPDHMIGCSAARNPTGPCVGGNPGVRSARDNLASA